VFKSLEKAQKRLIFLFTLLGVFFLCLFGVLHIFHDKKILGIVEIFIGVLSLLNVWIFKDRYDFSSRGIIFFMMALFWLLYITGGFKGQGIFWIYAFSPITFFLREKKEAIIWNVVFIGGIVFFQILSSLGIIKIAYSFITTFEAISSYTCIIFLSYFYSHTLTTILQTLKEKAIFDSLTGIYNREFLFSFLEREIERIKKEKERGFCLAFIDLDDFKRINDTYGHQKGDEILSAVSKIIKENFRSSDVFGRFGGDEFILAVNTNNKEVIEEKLKFIKNQIEKRFKDYGLSISYGIVELPKETADLDEALRLADERMYQMKNKKNSLKMIL
jgi:diguanylate cyclase (GGDEF)-like protein